jgi:hypothetical protein
LKDDRDRYGTFMWASPDVVARTITSLSAGKPNVAEEFGDAMARHLQSGGPVATLDGRVDALQAIYRRLDAAAQERVRNGMRGMGRIMGFNVTGIADHLIDRVTMPR